MSQECGFPISYPKPTTINPCCDNVTLSLEHLKAILDLIWLTDQGETSPSLVASLGGNLYEELERRIKVFLEIAREQEQCLAQLSARPPTVSRGE